VTASAVAARTARVPRIAAPRWLRVLLRSVLDLVLVVWLAATVAFLALRLIPGDPLDVLLSGVQDATPEMRAAIAAHYGLDQPVIVQYFAYLLGVVQGDLGTSYHRGAPVSEVLFGELGATVELTVAAMLLAVVLSAAIALLTSGQRPAVRFVAQAFEC
jgi:peptide/nickel transport system permease protein